MVSMKTFLSVLLVALTVLGFSPAFAADDSNASADPLVVSNYIAWWAHDDRGYHPAVAFMYQNESGEDLSDQLIRFQARFMDIKNNFLTVERKEVRGVLENGAQQRNVMVGPEAYELSIDSHSWPQIECKVLYKVGDEDEAHQLLLARTDAVTMTNEEAMQQILAHATRYVKAKPGRRKKKVTQTADAQPNDVAPVALSAGPSLPLNGPPPAAGSSSGTRTPKPTPPRTSDVGWHFKNPAGLSDDFFDFEQSFGRQVTFEASPNKWTWAKYQPPGDVALFAGAKQPGSKVDIVVAVVRSSKQIAEGQLIALGKEFIGKYRSQLLGSPARTVRYLPTGRVQSTNLPSSAYHFTIYSTNDTPDDNRYYVVLSKVPGSSDSVLLDQAKRVKLLRFLLPVVGESSDQ